MYGKMLSSRAAESHHWPQRCVNTLLMLYREDCMCEEHCHNPPMCAYSWITVQTMQLPRCIKCRPLPLSNVDLNLLHCFLSLLRCFRLSVPRYLSPSVLRSSRSRFYSLECRIINRFLLAVISYLSLKRLSTGLQTLKRCRRASTLYQESCHGGLLQ